MLSSSRPAPSGRGHHVHPSSAVPHPVAPQPDEELVLLCEAEHAAAFRMLDAGDLRHLIPRLSAHVNAAMELLLRQPGRDPSRRRAADRYQRMSRTLIEVLWTVDRRLTGDGRLSRLAVDDLQQALRLALARHAAAEIALAADATGRLGPLTVSRYARLLARAPHRPHPYLAGHRRIAHRLFRSLALVDAFRDIMDSRRVPTLPAQRSPTRWGTYLTGVQEFVPDPRHEP